MKKTCAGDGIIWLEPGNPETLTICDGCRICRKVMRRKIKNSKPLSKGEKKVLRDAGFPMKDLDIDLEKLMICQQQANSNYMNFLKSCLTVAKVAEILSQSEDKVSKMLVSNPPKLLGLRFQSHWLLPENQFHCGRLIPNFEKVLGVLANPSEMAITVASWLGKPDVEFQVGEKILSPREWLILGRSLKPVLIMAETLGIGL